MVTAPFDAAWASEMPWEMIIDCLRMIFYHGRSFLYLSEVVHHLGLVWLADEEDPYLRRRRRRQQGQQRQQGEWHGGAESHGKADPRSIIDVYIAI